MKEFKITTSITKREEASMEKYLRDINKIKMVSPEEEVSLAQRIHMGDKTALDCMVCANLRFVVTVAKQFQNMGLPLGDLINEGNKGLIHAAKKFDETRGFKFISFAVWWIRQNISQALDDYGKAVRLPSNKSCLTRKLKKLTAEFEQENERQPNDLELAEMANIDADIIKELSIMDKPVLSFDTPINTEDDLTLLDVTPDTYSYTDASLEQESLSSDILESLSFLIDLRERQVLVMFFGLNGTEYSLEEIADKLGLTRERARQIKEKGVRHLRSNAEVTNLLRKYCA